MRPCASRTWRTPRGFAVRSRTRASGAWRRARSISRRSSPTSTTTGCRSSVARDRHPRTASRSTRTDGGLFERRSGSCCLRNPTGASTCSRGHGPSGARSSRGNRAGEAVRQRAGYGWRVIDAAHGLRASEVAERVARGEVNRLPPPHTRTYGQIVRANVLTRFNALLGGMLMLILIVGPLQDALFGFVLVANAAIGIVQEVRAKRTLERLTVLTAPKAHVVRDREVHVIPVEQVVADDVLEISLGGQVVVDGEVLAAEGLEIDESLLTGESDPVQKAPGDPVRSGSFAVAGSGRYRATAIGSDAYAVKLAEEARRFTLTRSELRAGIDRILVWVTWAIVPTGALLFISQLRTNHGWRQAISGAVAGTVAMVPEGLILLMTIAFAAAVVRLAQRRVLVQELPAVEGLARVDVLCIDKTGTLTEGKLVVTSVSPVDGLGPVEEVERRGVRWPGGVGPRWGRRPAWFRVATGWAPSPGGEGGGGGEPRRDARSDHGWARRRAAPVGTPARGGPRAGRRAPSRRRRDPEVLRGARRRREGDLRRRSENRGRDRGPARPSGRRTPGRCPEPVRRCCRAGRGGRGLVGDRPCVAEPEAGDGPRARGPWAYRRDDRRRGERCPRAEGSGHRRGDGLRE